MAALFCIPPSNEWEFMWLHILTAFVMSRFWVLAILIGVVVSHCCFNVHFSTDKYLHMLICHLYPSIYLLWGDVCSDLCSFFFTLGCLFSWSFNYLENFSTSPLSDMCFANASLSVTWFFILWAVFFTQKRLFISMKFDLFTFSFIIHTFAV